jgi:hypothetical protein
VASCNCLVITKSPLSLSLLNVDFLSVSEPLVTCGIVHTAGSNCCVLMHEQCTQLPHYHICEQEKVNVCPQKCSDILVNIKRPFRYGSQKLAFRYLRADHVNLLEPNQLIGYDFSNLAQWTLLCLHVGILREMCFL